MFSGGIERDQWRKMGEYFSEALQSEKTKERKENARKKTKPECDF